MIKRNKTISIAKAMAIILMVMGHCSCPEKFRIIFCMFHMPLFFILSGYFFKTEVSGISGMKLFFIKRFKGLCVPYLYWGLPILLISPLLVGWGYTAPGYSGGVDLVKKIIRMIVLTDSHYGEAQPGFWFIKSLFHGSLLVCLLTVAANKLRVKIWSVLVITISVSVWLSFHPFNSMQKTIFGAFYGGTFYVLGYYYRNIIEKNINYNWGTIMLAAIVTFIGSITFGSSNFLYCDKPNFVISYLFYGMVGTLMCMALADKMKKCETLEKVMTYIGDNTMIVLALHTPFIRLTNVLLVYILNFPSEHMNEQFFPNYIPMLWVLHAIMGICIPVGIKYGYDNLKVRMLRN